MADYLLDCNHLSAAIRKVSLLRDRLHRERQAGHRLITCVPVLCELEVGIQQTAKPAEYRRRLTAILRNVRLWPTDLETSQIYGMVFHELRREGRALSQVDIVLVAMARQHKLTLLTSDQDFDPIADLRVENWIV